MTASKAVKIGIILLIGGVIIWGAGVGMEWATLGSALSDGSAFVSPERVTGAITEWMLVAGTGLAIGAIGGIVLVVGVVASMTRGR